jgi:hypothetical protein
VDYAALKGAYGKIIINELSISSDGIVQAYLFRRPYVMIVNTKGNNMFCNSGVHLDGGHIPYLQLSAVLIEAVEGYALRHGEMRLPLRADTPTLSQPGKLRLSSTPGTETRISCGFSCHRFPSVRCACRNTHCK